jgi:hypothetical protein
MGAGSGFRFAACVALAAGAAGCALPDGGGKALSESPVHGLISLELIASDVDGTLSVDGFAGATDDSEGDGGAAVLIDLLWPRWMISFHSGTHGLTEDLDLRNGSVLLDDTVGDYRHDDLFVGMALVTVDGPAPMADDAPRPPSAFRLDALVGGRLNTVTVDDIGFAGLDIQEEREQWGDALAGLRAEWRLSDWLALRGHGDARIAGASDDAWSLRASLVYGPTPGWAIGAGWEARSVDFESNSGSDRFDVRFSGPFLAFELLF